MTKGINSSYRMERVVAPGTADEMGSRLTAPSTAVQYPTPFLSNLTPPGTEISPTRSRIFVESAKQRRVSIPDKCKLALQASMAASYKLPYDADLKPTPRRVGQQVVSPRRFTEILSLSTVLAHHALIGYG
jgi:hypothetical protein